MKRKFFKYFHLNFPEACSCRSDWQWVSIGFRWWLAAEKGSKSLPVGWTNIDTDWCHSVTPYDVIRSWWVYNKTREDIPMPYHFGIDAFMIFCPGSVWSRSLAGYMALSLLVTCIEYWPLKCLSYLYINALVQERRKSSVLAMELHHSCTNPSIWDPNLVITVSANRWVSVRLQHLKCVNSGDTAVLH